MSIFFFNFSDLHGILATSGFFLFNNSMIHIYNVRMAGNESVFIDSIWWRWNGREQMTFRISWNLKIGLQNRLIEDKPSVLVARPIRKFFTNIWGTDNLSERRYVEDVLIYVERPKFLNTVVFHSAHYPWSQSLWLWILPVRLRKSC